MDVTAISKAICVYCVVRVRRTEHSSIEKFLNNTVSIPRKYTLQFFQFSLVSKSVSQLVSQSVSESVKMV